MIPTGLVVSQTNASPTIRKLKLQQHDKRWLNDVMNEIHTSMNDTYLNKISKCVDKTNQFTIQSYWINNTVNSTKISKTDIDLQSTPINNINTPILHKIKLQLMVQSDSGANCNLINDLDLFSDVHDIPNRTFATCNTSDTSNIISNKAGYILCRDDTGHLIRTKVYYAKETDGTVLSPIAITKQNNDRFDGWIQYTNNDSQTGRVVLTGRSGYSNLTFHTFGYNDLWYYDLNELIPHSPIVNSLSQQTTEKPSHTIDNNTNIPQ